MLITCPNCLSQFSISDEIIPQEGKKVQCSICLHTWRQMPTPKEITMPDAKIPEQVESFFPVLEEKSSLKSDLPEEFCPVKTKSSFKWIFLGILVFICIGIGWWSYSFFPTAQSSKQDNLKDFSISNIQQELFVRSDHSTRIRLQGEILNISADGRNIPPLKADIKPLDGFVLETQILPSKKVYLQSGDSYLFFEDIISLYPPPLVVDVHF